MKRSVAVTLAMLLGAIGCGSSANDNTPAVSAVTVTVQHNGAPLENVMVQESVSVASETVLDGGLSDAAGQRTFDVPSTTTTGNLCFISYWYPDGNLANSRVLSSCHSLNAVPASVTLNYTD